MTNWLSKLKKDKTTIPLSLFVIEGDGEVREVLRSEELNQLEFKRKDDSTRTIIGVVTSNIGFNGDSFNPLSSVDSLGKQLTDKKTDIKKVLYFTDSRFFPEPVYDSDVGTLRAWHYRNVKVKVITDRYCERWQDQDLVECEIMEKPTLKHLEKILEQWLEN